MTQKLARRARAKKSTAEVDAGKISKLIKLLSSDKPGEVVAAASALKRTLGSAGLDLHDLAAAAERGLLPVAPPQQPRAASWGPPLPSPDNWQELAWWLHWHRWQLRGDQRERVADYLLGQAFYDTDGRCMSWHIDELREMVSSVRAAARSTAVRR